MSSCCSCLRIDASLVSTRQNLSKKACCPFRTCRSLCSTFARHRWSNGWQESCHQVYTCKRSSWCIPLGKNILEVCRLSSQSWCNGGCRTFFPCKEVVCLNTIGLRRFLDCHWDGSTFSLLWAWFRWGLCNILCLCLCWWALQVLRSNRSYSKPCFACNIQSEISDIPRPIILQ